MAVCLTDIRQLAADLLREDRLLTNGEVLCAYRQTSVTLRWEIFHGRLLEESQTRRTQTFESRHLILNTSQASEVPLLALLLDVEQATVHVVRGLPCHVWEGYESESGVYLSRERQKWTRELIASFPLSTFSDLADARLELTAALHRAVVGSRLPLTPVEAPLPAFSFGALYYPEETPCFRDLEFALRRLRGCVNDGIASLVDRLPAKSVIPTLRKLFLEVSLSPWTDFVERVLRFLREFHQRQLLPTVEIVDFESWLLRLVSRHLTAYDLMIYHHRGANYPDALLLDLVLKDYLRYLEMSPELFCGDQGRIRRRALRQAYCLRRSYEGHPVPDRPTSPGEHQRVYPDEYERVPEEQITNPARRQKRLFEGESLQESLSASARKSLLEAVADLVHPSEWRELGAAVYLDRPLGGGKAAVSPDQTPLLSSLAFSGKIASQRQKLLGEDFSHPACLQTESHPVIAGLPLHRIGPPIRQGTVSLSDAARVSGDFVFCRTMSGSVKELFSYFEAGPVEDLLQATVLLARSPSTPGVVLYDAEWNSLGEIVPNLSDGYISRRGIEIPHGGLVLYQEGQPQPIVLFVRPNKSHDLTEI